MAGSGRSEPILEVRLRPRIALQVDEQLGHDLAERSSVHHTDHAHHQGADVHPEIAGGDHPFDLPQRFDDQLRLARPPPVAVALPTPALAATPSIVIR